MPKPLFTSANAASSSARSGAVARLKIMAAAEWLFAEQGIEAVSLRQIAVAAGNGNNNAVKYYFGSKGGLIDAIFEHRVLQMEDVRRADLEQAREQNKLDDALTLTQILCLPHLQLRNTEGKHPYAGFISQYLTRYRARGMLHAADILSESGLVLTELLSLIEQRIAYVPNALVNSRIALSNLVFVNMLVRWDNMPAAEQRATDFDELVLDTLEISTGLLCAPYREQDRSVLRRYTG